MIGVTDRNALATNKLSSTLARCSHNVKTAFRKLEKISKKTIDKENSVVFNSDHCQGDVIWSGLFSVFMRVRDEKLVRCRLLFVTGYSDWFLSPSSNNVLPTPVFCLFNVGAWRSIMMASWICRVAMSVKCLVHRNDDYHFIKTSHYAPAVWSYQTTFSRSAQRKTHSPRSRREYKNC